MRYHVSALKAEEAEPICVEALYSFSSPDDVSLRCGTDPTLPTEAVAPTAKMPLSADGAVA